MSFRKKPTSRPTHSRYQNNNRVPSWLVFIIGVAVVFGAYYLWIGVRNFIATDGLGIQEATQQARIIITSTAERVATQEQLTQVTPFPTATPIPECMDFRVSVDRANVRQQPSLDGAFIVSFVENQIVCVLGQDSEEWYTIDLTPSTRRVELGVYFPQYHRSSESNPNAINYIYPITDN